MTSTGPQKTTEEGRSHSRVLRYDGYFDQRTFAYTFRKSAKPREPKSLSTKNPILIVKRLIDDKGRHASTTVDIKNPVLIELLRDLNSDVDGLELDRCAPTADPKLFFHCYHGIRHAREQEQAKEEPEATRLDVLEETIQYIEGDHGGTISEFETLSNKNVITYDLLWALFRPNCIVYRFHEWTEQVQLLRARETYYSKKEDGTYYFGIYCDFITNDGDSFGFTGETLEIVKFAGACKIQGMVVYPLQYREDEHALRESIVTRGKKFAAMGKCYCQISGPAMRDVQISELSMRESLDMRENQRVKKFYANGRVVIDPSAFRLFNPNCGFNLGVHRTVSQSEMTEEMYLICSPVVLAFSLTTKLWGGFAISGIADIAWSDDAFDLLVLGTKQKQLIRALVKQHSQSAPQFDDIVAGKGKGLIGLLCGRPGCGKTLTAEAVADLNRVPLYVISAGELGVEPSLVDQRLAAILDLAQKWNAVVLLDEAEVFLQQRTASDVQRNALVSIFLRQLEYYQGILILTTNLLGQCDLAFESRIHFSIHYPDLNQESRKKIWKMFLDRSPAAGNISEQDVDKLAVLPLNGRQIKNVFSSATCIAADAGSTLSMEYIDTVLEVVNDWQTAKNLLAVPSIA